MLTATLFQDMQGWDVEISEKNGKGIAGVTWRPETRTASSYRVWVAWGKADTISEAEALTMALAKYAEDGTPHAYLTTKQHHIDTRRITT